MTGRFLDPSSIEGSDDDGETLASVGGIPTWLTGSAGVIPLPAGSDDSDVPAGTPINTIILVKA
jgi:hypothetical protein